MPSRSASGAEIASTMRAATERATVASTRPGQSTTNSSPPRRPGAVRRAQHAIDPLGHDHEGLVARAVPERVVDLLEAVEIDEEQAQLAVVEGMPHELVHQPAVGQPVSASCSAQSET